MYTIFKKEREREREYAPNNDKITFNDYQS